MHRIYTSSNIPAKNILVHLETFSIYGFLRTENNIIQTAYRANVKKDTDHLKEEKQSSKM